MINYTTTAIGTHRNIDFLSPLETSSQISSLFDGLFQNFEKKYSRFIESSLVSQLNINKTLETDDEDLIKMILLGLEYEQKTFGYFSLFIWSTLEQLWYWKTNNQEKTSTPEIKRTSEDTLIETSNIIIREIWNWKNHIILLSDNHIDLGWLGKWYLIYLIEKLFIEHNINTYRINGGWDIAISQETIDTFGNIVLQNPLNKEEAIGEVYMLKWSCCGSWLLYRRWKLIDPNKATTTQAHHLINPHTKQPAQTSLVGVFTNHPNSIIADIAATTLFVAPIEKIEHIAEEIGIEYLLIFDDLSIIRSRAFPLQ